MQNLSSGSEVTSQSHQRWTVPAIRKVTRRSFRAEAFARESKRNSVASTATIANDDWMDTPLKDEYLETEQHAQAKLTDPISMFRSSRYNRSVAWLPSPPVGWISRQQLWKERSPKSLAPSLPTLDPMKILKVHLAVSGGHGSAYVVTASIRDETPRKIFLKLFTDVYETEAKAEILAYSHFIRHGICGIYVPQIYGASCYSYSEWQKKFPNLPLVAHHSETIQRIRAIGIQYLEGFTQISLENISLEVTGSALTAMSAIHASDIVHDDIALRNLLVRSEDNRAVWVDFSCSRSRPSNKKMWEEINRVSKLLIDDLVLPPKPK
jgi:hypothetical protein